MKNWTGFNGVRFCDRNYSAFPNEQEYVMNEKFPVFVLGTEEGQIIENTNPDLSDYHHKKVTIIYLYNDVDDEVKKVKDKD